MLLLVHSRRTTQGAPDFSCLATTYHTMVHTLIIYTKNNIPYNLAKRIIVFVSNPEKVTCLDELRLLCQNYLNETNNFTIPNGQIWEIC